MADSNSKATSKPYSLYADHIQYVAVLAARLYDGNDSAALRAIIDDNRDRYQDAYQAAPQPEYTPIVPQPRSPVKRGSLKHNTNGHNGASE